VWADRIKIIQVQNQIPAPLDLIPSCSFGETLFFITSLDEVEVMENDRKALAVSVMSDTAKG